MKEKIIGQKIENVVSNGHQFSIELENGLIIELGYDNIYEKFEATVFETVVKKVGEL
jgi:hypothetical protein